MSLADCKLSTLIAAAKCFDCLSSTEKQALEVYIMAAVLKAVDGTDYTDINVRNKAAACFCVADFRLQSMELAVWKSAADALGVSLPSTIDGLRALIKCVPCGEQKTTRAAYVLILCEILRLETQVPCWVAREVYGPSDYRWRIFRDWLMGPAPGWFRALYVGFGQRFAAWISDKPRIKAFIRRLMDRVVNR